MTALTDAKLQVFGEYLNKAQRLCDENKPFERMAYAALVALEHAFPHEKVSEAAEGWIARKQYAIALRYLYFALDTERLKQIVDILPNADWILHELATIFLPPDGETVVLSIQRSMLAGLIGDLEKITMDGTILACALLRDMDQASSLSDFSDKLHAAGKIEEAAVAKFEYEL